MALTPGTRLGPYEILVAIGAGGMGEVYRATDSQLKRSVAIKVLPALVAGDADRLVRFQREAEVLAALNHPNIAAIYGLEKTSDLTALVMELVDGEDLSAHLARGPMPLTDALPIAKQIAEALEAAHEQGVIHRDLKPANIKVRADGTVKVLDFGLAKAIDPAGTSSGEAMNSPTMTARATQMGMILGTAAYMSPEQARGKAVDRRADIWAFGVVLYEMLTGRRAFEGDDISITLANVLKEDVRWDALPADLPAPLVRLLRRCLERDPRQRLRDIGDARIELVSTESDPETTAGAPSPAARPKRSIERWIWMGVSATLAAVTAATLLRRGGSAPADTSGPTVRAMVPFATAENLAVDAAPSVALSPDGHYIAYRGGTPAQLYVRATDESQSRAVAGTEGGVYPFFSADGKSLGFFIGRTIKRLALGGGAPVTIVDLTTANLRGVAWGDDGWIYYTPTVSAGLWRIRESGGVPEQLTTPDFAAGEKTHRFPYVLPGSKAVLFMVGTSRLTSFADARIEALSLDTKTRTKLVEGGSYPQYAITGHLLYTRNAQLIAVPFDDNQLKLTGPPVTIASDMFADPYYGMGNYGVSRNGVAVRIVGGASQVPQTLTSVDRSGAGLPLKNAPAVISSNGRVSPDGTQLATYLTGATSQLALFDLSRGTSTRVTYEWDNETAVWSPDGSRLAFVSNRGGGARNVFVMRADGGGSAERLTKSDHEQQAFSWSADGKAVAYTDTDPASGDDIWTVSIDDRKSAPLVKSPADDGAPAFSPDGHWIAYQSRQSSRMEVYVQSFPNGERRWQISTNGGTTPYWQRDGREIIYRSGTSVMSVPISTTPAFHQGEPVRLFDTPNVLVDVLPGGRLLMRTRTQPPPVSQLEVIVNWFSELRRRSGG